MCRIVVVGAAGRMGRQLVAAVLERSDLTLAGASEHPQHDLIGTDVGVLVGEKKTGVRLSADLDDLGDSYDVIIDFTAPGHTRSILTRVAESNKRAVIGTTGLTTEDKQFMEDCAKRSGIVFASNYSIGVTLSLELLATAAKVLGSDYDVEVIEAHHRHKVDAPSGTALSMGEAVAAAMDLDLEEHGVFARHGITGERKPQTIGFSTVRAGDIVGEHTVMFCGQGERLEITHKATDRMTFARGAVRAASWLAGRPVGLYSMKDVVSAN